MCFFFGRGWVGMELGGGGAPPAHAQEWAAPQGGGAAAGEKVVEKSQIFEFSQKLYLGAGWIGMRVRVRVRVFSRAQPQFPPAPPFCLTAPAL